MAKQLRYGPIVYILVVLTTMSVLLIARMFTLQQRAIMAMQSERGLVLSAQVNEEIRHLREDFEVIAHSAGPTDLSADRLTALLAQMPRHESQRIRLAAVDAAGQLVGVNPDSAAISAALQELVEGERPFPDDTHYMMSNTAEAEPLFLIVKPILDEAGSRRGTLLLQVDLDFLQITLSEVYEDLGYAYLVDRTNDLIIYIENDVLKTDTLSTHPHVADLLTGTGIPLNSGPLSLKSFAAYRGLFGDRVLRQATAVAAPNWDLVVEIAVEQAFAPVLNLIWLSSFGLLLGACGAILLGIYFSREIVSPLTQLTHAAGQLSRGNLNIHLPEFRQNELGLLAATFNQMVEQLQETVTYLEQSVQDRTSTLKRRSMQIQAAAETARDATSAYQLKELINRAVNLVPSRFGYYHAGIFLVDDEGEYAVLQAATGVIGQQMLARRHKLRIGKEGIVGRVIDSGHAYITSDTHQDNVYWPNPLLPNTRSEMGLPLKVGERVIGAMNVQSREVAAFDQEDITILQILTDQLAVAIEKTRLFEKMQAMLTERLRTIISNVPLILFSFDREGLITLAEGKGLVTLGVSDIEYMGKSVWEVFAGQPGVLDDIRKALRGEMIVSTTTLRGLTWDIQYIPLYDGQNKVTGVIGVAADITERRKAEESLREKERQLRQIIDLVPHMIFARDRNGRFLLVNRALADAYDMEVDALTGMSSRNVHPDLAELTRFLADDQEVIRSHQPKSIREETFSDAYGRQRTLQTSKIPLAWSREDETAVLGVSVDITERKQAEEAMRQAQKLESLGVLAGGVAHDFNNLLVAILGQTSLALIRLPPESPARRAIEKASKAAERAADLTRQLLAYSGRGHFEIHPLNFNILIQENLHLFEVAVPKQVQLRSDLTNPLPLIEGDAGQMQQVIMNLILNGAEAIGAMPGTVTVSTGIQIVEQQDSHLWQYTGEPIKPGTYVTLEVQDTGHGMDGATLRKIFDPFFTTKKAGRGLGLAAVLGIVRGHRGGIRVYSEPEKGTLFKVLFPAIVPDLNVEAEAPLSQTPLTSPGKILIIDDETSVRETAADILANESFSVLTAANGQAGLDLYRQHMDQIQLVLLDLSMPGLSGEETFRELRKVNEKVQVILSSGYNEVEATRRFLGRGLAGFLQKPYSARQLLETVRQWIAGE